jgi:hypothetical protein
MKTYRPRWNAARDQILVKLWAENLPCDVIAEQIDPNITAGAVKWRAGFLCLPSRERVYSTHWTPQNVATLKRLWGEEGWSASDIARQMGAWCTRSAVIGKAHRMKLPMRSGPDCESRRITSKRHAQRQRRAGMRLLGQAAPPAAKRMEPAPLPPPEAPTACSVKFEDLLSTHCRWPYDTPTGRVFCGCEAVPGKSWCAGHLFRVYRPLDAIPIRRRELPQVTFYDLVKEDA